MDEDELLPLVMGGAGGMALPFDMTDDEAEEMMADLKAKESRRRPPGFAPWPEDARPSLRVVA